ncbi:MAG: IS5 family transposase [Proteobacteria bacterium]|nr:IS5 family transposase [Pseudomonadota bacterium]
MREYHVRFCERLGAKLPWSTHQHFCGFEYFQHRLPLDPSSMTRWRQRVGAEGIEKLLRETVQTAQRGKVLERRHLERVNVDTTVQEKAIAYPTDARLYDKARRALVRAAAAREIALRQSYPRLGKKALVMQGRYAHARQLRRARRETKKLKTYLGRVIRDLRRQCPRPDPELATLLTRAERIHRQQRHDKDKLYSMHAPEVACIAKGKAHKKYEFGCKVSVATTSRDNWIVGVQALHGNPYDGHTLENALGQVARSTGWPVGNAYCDRGYQGNPKHLGDTAVQLCKGRKRAMPRSAWHWVKRRAAVEPIIGHLKGDHRMDRNHLKGADGDRINALLAGCGFNIRKLLRELYWLIFKLLTAALGLENGPCYTETAPLARRVVGYGHPPGDRLQAA